ncbi:MAG: MotA/TolQ/ExbB proton channel family protein [Phycisphaerales bacterium]|nr:MotA/TolQ/ExbB proton channel family protein [Phycisphaerales bacterium]
MTKPSRSGAHRARVAARLGALVVLVACALWFASPVGAQDPPPLPATADAEPAATEQSFASAFFICRSTVVGPNGREITKTQWLGSLLIWGLMALSAVSLGLIGSIAWNHRRASIWPSVVHDELRSLLDRGEYDRALATTDIQESYFCAVVHASLAEAPHGYPAMVRALEQASDAETTARLRIVEPLNVIGNVAPMVGLFGTVYGMILAFQTIVASGGTPSPKLLAAGIGTALTTTFWGLVVAIPALSGYAFLRNRIDSLTTQANAAAEELVAMFRPARNARVKTTAPPTS